MKKFSRAQIITTGLAIFSMFFGAGNLMYPVSVGISSGPYILWGLLGFLMTAVVLPFTGLITMILFNGDYKSFFYRMGSTVGSLIILACMLIIGPVIAIPRIVTVSYTFIEPFLYGMPSLVFALIFIGLTFLMTYKESRIVSLLGDFISPALLISLGIIIIKGLVSADVSVATQLDKLHAFTHNLKIGYETLDLLGGIFFSSIILTMLKSSNTQENYSLKDLALIGLKSGLLGTSLLALVYIGMGILSMFHGHTVTEFGANPALQLRMISDLLLGQIGAAVLSIAVLMACFSTSIALVATVGDYMQKTVCNNKISFAWGAALISIASLPLSIAGLEVILGLAGGPILYVGYPVLIAITLCNLAHKLCNFNYIKIPVLLTFVVTCISYIYS